MNALRLLDKEIFLEIFYEKRKKNLIFLMDFYIFYESGVKNFLKWFISNFPNGIH